MPSPDPARAKQLLIEALDRLPALRREFIEKQCGDDIVLRERVEALLRAYDEAAGFLDRSGEAAPRSSDQADASAPTIHRSHETLDSKGLDSGSPSSSHQVERSGGVIGRYKLLEQIGEGGFGTVWMAEQEQPVRRRVALKVIKLGMDTRQVIARFEAERQALAMMDHPNIAKVLDAGATETGRPYFVMELVKGVPITQYCDDNNLTPQQRLELFVSVCQAVQHAHQKGIIHRDIKPNNVLVSRHDDRPVVKVIDFGIAKATGGRLTEKTVFTELRQMIGTPTYMSPEQAGLSDLDIDTRSDIYSLGVLLYELLTGTTPFEMKTLLKAGYAEIQRMIREVEPPTPSTRLSTLKENLPSVAAQRKTEPARLTKLVRGDLDWIVMKCLEKDRARRYETANGLAADIHRYLGGEAVIAAPPSASYRLRKFVRRHRAAVTAGSLVTIVLLLGVAGTSYGLVWALRERDRAAQEASRAKALNEFMQHMILAANPESEGNREVTVVDMLLKASEKADQTLRDEPIAEGEARTFLAATFRTMGRIAEAEKAGRRAVELRETGPERNTLHHAESIRTLANVQSEQGNYQAARENCEKALMILRPLETTSPKELIHAYLDLAQAFNRLGQFAESETTLDQGEAVIERRRPGDLDLKADYLGCRATTVFGRTGDFEKADELETEAVTLRRRHSPANLLADSLNSLAIIRMQRGKSAEALELFQECLAIQRKEYGDTHHRVAVTIENMANVYFTMKRNDEALKQLNEVLEIRTKLFGADSFPAARTRFNMGVLASESGDPSRGLELIDAALPVFRKQLGDAHFEVGQVLRSRGQCHRRLGDYEAALRDLRAALGIFDAAVAPTERSRLRAIGDLAELLCLQGSTEEGERIARRTIAQLDPQKTDQAKWIKRLNEQLTKCREGGATSQPSSAPASRPAGGN